MDRKLLAFAIALVSSLGLATTAGAAANPTDEQSSAGGQAAVEPGLWQEHKIEFAYLGFTSHYSCDGLQAKLEVLLKRLGARPGAKIMTYGCDRGFGTPSRFPRATLTFATLKPADAAAAGAAGAAAGEQGATSVPGSWRKVDIAPNRPFDLLDGDCELMEQFRDKILPAFSTRAQQLRITCIPHQDSGPFSVQLQVFAPVPAAASK